MPILSFPLSPFSSYFHELRRRYRVSQKELAKRMGYEQGYISGLEVGRKGPPNEEFIGKLIETLDLDEDEQIALRQTVAESQRRYVLPGDASTDVYKLVRKLWGEMNNLQPTQIRAINEILSFQDRKSLTAIEHGCGILGKQIQEAKM